MPGSAVKMERMLVDQIGVLSLTFETDEGRRLHYLSLEPGSYGFEPTYQDTGEAFSFAFSIGEAQASGSPRGTVVLLHGWSTGAVTMFPWLAGLAQNFFRTVALDLRGHGSSDPAPLGFGPREAEDVIALVDHLEEAGQLQEPLYLLGVSYGAAAAAFAAERLKQRVAGTILIAPYGNAATGIASGVAGLLAVPPSGLAGHAVRAAQKARYDESHIEAAIDRASESLGLNLRELDVGDALEATETCGLLLHGALDRLIPVAAARTLAQRGASTRFVEFPNDGHFSLPLRVDWLTQALAAWMADACEGKGTCPELQLPEDPAIGRTDRQGSPAGRAEDSTERVAHVVCARCCGCVAAERGTESLQWSQYGTMILA